MKNVLIFLFILILAPFPANAKFPDNENDIRWSLYKNGPVKDKRGRSGVYLPTAFISDAGLTFQSCIGMSLPYAIVAEEENTIDEGLMNLRKDEPMVISVADLAPGEYEIRITIDDIVYAGTFYVEYE